MAGTSSALKLGLGTVQFGLDYGISNRGGKVLAGQVGTLLQEARRGGIDLLDTAVAYGDAEAVLGQCAAGEMGFQMVTKLPPLPAALDAGEVGRWVDQQFQASLTRLRCEAVYGLMMHRAQDLLGANGPALWQALTQLCARGVVERIGASVYDGEEIDALLERHDPTLIQLPINLLDQRLLAGGQLNRLASRGVEVHARSLLLQGLLLMEADQTDAHFEPARPALKRFAQDAADAGISRLQAALRFASTLPEISRIIVGVTSIKELEEVIDASRGPGLADYRPYAIGEEQILNPAKWPQVPR